MKRLLAITITLLMTSVHANDFERPIQGIAKKIIKDEVHETTITLDKSTVRCSALGYGSSELKISVPSLEWYAIFDHSNRDDRGPCVTAGMDFCTVTDDFINTKVPDLLVNPEKPTEKINVRVFLKEVFEDAGENCLRKIEEHVETEVRGIPFTHMRVKSIGTLPLSECHLE